MPEFSEDVMGVITERIEDRFQMPIADLRRAVKAAPQANSEATTIVRWYGLLTETQNALNTAEDALVEALGTQSGELEDPVMELAQQVNTAVAARDGRAMVVNHLLDGAPAVWRGASSAARRAPALPTTAPGLPGLRGVAPRGATR